MLFLCIVVFSGIFVVSGAGGAVSVVVVSVVDGGVASSASVL